MHDLDALAARYRAGDAISFGPRVTLQEGTLHLPDGSLALNTVDEACLEKGGNALVRRLGRDRPPILVPASELDDPDGFVRLINHLVRAIPYVQRRSSTGWPPGSIGDLSARLGTDVRELLMAGYTDQQIQGVLHGEYTLEELYARRPRGKRMRLRDQRS